MTSSATLRKIYEEKSTSEKAEDLKEKMSDLKTNFANRALTIVHEVMPAKVLELHDVFKNNPLFNMTTKEMNDITLVTLGKGVPSTATDTSSPAPDEKRKKRKVAETKKTEHAEDGKDVRLNKVLLDIMDYLKKEIVDLIEAINTVKIWIQLNIPRIEDGNNFGVSIQEETVSELGRAEDSGFAVLENMTKFFISRAKVVSKVEKFPHVEDYVHSVVELDEKEYITLRLCLLDLRNSYAILHDMITKNLEKIKAPRGTNHMAALF